jgi:hypothetical protein
MGLALLIMGGSSLIITTIGLFTNLIPPTLDVSLVNVSMFCILLGGVFTMFLGRLGWTESKVLDILFNRLSIFLILLGLISQFSDKLLPSGVGYGVFITGIILILLGMRFQTSV